MPSCAVNRLRALFGLCIVTGGVVLTQPSAATVPQPVTVKTIKDVPLAVEVAITPDGKTAYVVGLNDSVTAIDTASNTIKDTIWVGHFPVGIAITPDGKSAYVTNKMSASVSVIDTSTNTVATTISLRSQRAEPEGVAVTSDGEVVYVANSGTGTLSAIGTRRNTFIGSDIDVTAAAGVAVTPDGQYVYVTNNQRVGQVAVLDTGKRVVTKTIDVGTDPLGVAMAPDGATAYVTHPTTGSLSVIKTSSNTVTKIITSAPEIGAQGVAVAPDGSSVYVTNPYLDTVSVIDTASNTQARLVGVGEGPWGIAITPDGRFAYVANRFSENVSVVDLFPQPAFDAAPATVAFADQRVHTRSPARTVTVTNTGSAAMSIGAVSLGGSQPDQFAVDATTCTGAVVDPKGTCSVSVSFAPAGTGPKSAALVFSDDSLAAPHAVTLTGDGIDVPDPTPTPTPSGKMQQSPNRRGIPPGHVKGNGVTVIQGRNARTDAGQPIRALVTGRPIASNSAGDSRFLTVIRGAKGKVSVRTYGTPVRVVVRQSAAATAGYQRYQRRTVYVTR